MLNMAPVRESTISFSAFLHIDFLSSIASKSSITRRTLGPKNFTVDMGSSLNLNFLCNVSKARINGNKTFPEMEITN